MGSSQSRNEVPKMLKVVADIRNTEAPKLQRRDPTLWSMTLTQWNQVVSECRSHPLFAELIRKKERDKYVNLYDINDCFVKPWTRGSGCGIALHMNPSGLKAEVMMSHCWAEDVEECQEALRFRFAEFDHAPAVWFCLFALYQPADEAGPSIEEQLSGSTDDARPKDSAGKTWTAFKCVLHSVRIMVAIHTTKAELYERLWCVHELDEAMELCRKGDMTVIPALSKQYMDNVDDRFMMAKRAGATDKEAQAFAGFKVVTSRAVCGKADLEMLMAEIFSRPGGFERLDKNINEFRKVVYEQLKARRLQGLPRGDSNVSIEFDFIAEHDIDALALSLANIPKAAPEIAPTGPKVEVVFLNGDKEKVTVHFTKKPLGMSFANKEPLSVTKLVPGSHAEELGIQIGWEFQTIAGRDVAGQEWKTVVNFFHEQAAPLPGP